VRAHQDFLNAIDRQPVKGPLELRRISPAQAYLLQQLDLVDRNGAPRPEYALLPDMRVYVVDRGPQKTGVPRYGMVYAGPVKGPNATVPYLFGVSGIASEERDRVATLVQADFGAKQIGLPAKGEKGGTPIVDVPLGALSLYFSGERMDLVSHDVNPVAASEFKKGESHPWPESQTQRALRSAWLTKVAAKAGAASPAADAESIPPALREEASAVVELVSDLSPERIAEQANGRFGKLVNERLAEVFRGQDGERVVRAAELTTGAWTEDFFRLLMTLPNEAFQTQDTQNFRNAFLTALEKQPVSPSRTLLLEHFQRGRHGTWVQANPRLRRLWLDDVVRSYEAWSSEMEKSFHPELAIDPRVPLVWHRRFASERPASTRRWIETLPAITAFANEATEQSAEEKKRVDAVLLAWRRPAYEPVPGRECDRGFAAMGLGQKILIGTGAATATGATGAGIWYLFRDK
jgi:hypothetical protein